MNDKPASVDQLFFYLLKHPFVFSGMSRRSGNFVFRPNPDQPEVITFRSPEEDVEILLQANDPDCRFAFDDEGFWYGYDGRRSRFVYLPTSTAVPQLKCTATTTLGDLIDAVNFACRPLFDESDFSLLDQNMAETLLGVFAPGSVKTENQGYNKWHSLAVYPISGGSEGHYVCISFIFMDGRVRSDGLLCKNLATCKTFRGLKHAEKIASVAREVLEYLI